MGRAVIFGNGKAIESAPLLHPDIVVIKTAGWLNMDRDLKKQPVTPEEDAMLKRATSNAAITTSAGAGFSSCPARVSPGPCWT